MSDRVLVILVTLFFVPIAFLIDGCISLGLQNLPLYLVASLIYYLFYFFFLDLYQSNESKKEKAIQKQQLHDKQIKEFSEKKTEFYNKCVSNGITSSDDLSIDKNKQIAQVLVKNLNLEALSISVKGENFNIVKTFEKEKALVSQKEIQALKIEEIQKYNQQNKFSNYFGKNKSIAYYESKLSVYTQQIQEIDNFLNNSHPENLLQKENDWATLGGIADGIAGPAAGVATALDIQNKNREIRSQNMETSRNIAKYMFLIRDKKYDLEKKANSIRKKIEQENFKLTGEESSEECFSKLTINPNKVTVSKTGTCYVSASITLDEPLYIFNDVPAMIDGTIIATVYQDGQDIGDVNLVLPIYGVDEKNVIKIEGLLLNKGNPQTHTELKFHAGNLWTISKEALNH